MAIDAVDIQIANKINLLISDAYKRHLGMRGMIITRTIILDSAWGEIVGYRQSQGANDTISVCAEHYLYARSVASKGLSEALAIRAGAVGYDAYKIVKLPFQIISEKVSPEKSKGGESQFELRHVYWEQKGANDGALDRASPNTPVSLCLLSA